MSAHHRYVVVTDELHSGTEFRNDRWSARAYEHGHADELEVEALGATEVLAAEEAIGQVIIDRAAREQQGGTNGRKRHGD